MSVKLYEHQKKAVRELSNGSILCGGVGTGKSRTALAYFFYRVCGGTVPGKPLKARVPLCIITTARKRDTKEWDSELSAFLFARDSAECPIDIIVDSWNNIAKHASMSGAFFIFDEQRIVGTGSWTKAFWKIAKRNRWIVLSATPGDTWLDYAPIFIANGYYRNITDFRKQHVVYSAYTNYPKVDHYTNVARLEAIRDRVLVDMPYERTATKHHVWVSNEYPVDAYSDVRARRWNPYDNVPIANASEYCYILRRVANSDASRLSNLEAIVAERRRAIVFYNFDYELDILRRWASSTEVDHSEWNGHRHDPLPDSERWVYFVQYTAGAEGWNCVTANTVVFFSQSYSYKATVQAAGRIDRLNTPYTDLYFYHFTSASPIDAAIAKCLKGKKDFNAAAFGFA